MLDKLTAMRNYTNILVVTLIVVFMSGCENDRMTRYDNPVIVTLILEENSIVSQIEASPDRQSVGKTIGDYTFIIAVDVALALLGSDTGIPMPTSLDIYLCKVSGKKSENQYQLKWGRNSFVSESAVLDGEWVIKFDAPRIHKTSKPFTFSNSQQRITLHAELENGAVQSPNNSPPNSR